MSEQLTLPCAFFAAAAAESTDRITVRATDLGKSGPHLFVRTFQKGAMQKGETITYIDEKSARELFNWLGVWLHGGNRS